MGHQTPKVSSFCFLRIVIADPSRFTAGSPTPLGNHAEAYVAVFYDLRGLVRQYGLRPPEARYNGLGVMLLESIEHTNYPVLYTWGPGGTGILPGEFVIGYYDPEMNQWWPNKLEDHKDEPNRVSMPRSWAEATGQFLMDPQEMEESGIPIRSFCLTAADVRPDVAT